MEKKLASLKGGGKFAKLERKMAGAYDRIVLGAPANASPTITSGRVVTPHWRRGHFRHQAYGEGRLLRKLVFIEALQVNADVDAVPMRPKDYQMTEKRGPMPQVPLDDENDELDECGMGML
jgi:hypothetical protein